MLRLGCACLLVLLAQIAVPRHDAVKEHHISSCSDDDLAQLAVHRDYFYVGGEYVTMASGEGLMKNQMYVEKLSATGYESTQPYPLVLIHGKANTGITWLNTPDGRPGWASYFLCQGYVVYIIDQPTRGRSPWLPGDFAMDTVSFEYIEARITATEKYNLWPQSTKHTQWPGTGEKGDPIFDAFYASTVQFLSNDTEAQIKTRDAVVALLDKIGAAVLLTHSQGGLYGWPIADSRPHLVKAIVAVEPTGPPFQQAVFGNNPARAWGLTDIAMTYSPEVSKPLEQIKTVKVPSIDSDLYSSCIMQVEPHVHVLPNLKDIPVLIVVSESSFHAVYDHCSAKFLLQAGVKNVELLRLENVGIKGNGHAMMVENNNLKVARVLQEWVQKNVD